MQRFAAIFLFSLPPMKSLDHVRRQVITSIRVAISDDIVKSSQRGESILNSAARFVRRSSISAAFVSTASVSGALAAASAAASATTTIGLVALVAARAASTTSTSAAP